MEPNEHEVEQHFATMRRVIPRMWWNLYQGSLEQGFDESQAFTLLTTYILSQNPNGIRPDRGCGPVSDNPQ